MELNERFRKRSIVVNECGELVAFMITAGNHDDRKAVPSLSEKIFGKIFGDKGYISSELGKILLEKGIQLITKLKSNMKNKLMPMIDTLLLRKRGIIETIIDQLKNISQIEHSRHRSPINFAVNIFAGLIAYTYREKKPSIHVHEIDLKLLTVC
ncbi:MAG: IS982 family transposase [Chlamydia sp.]